MDFKIELGQTSYEFHHCIFLHLEDSVQVVLVGDSVIGIILNGLYMLLFYGYFII